MSDSSADHERHDPRIKNLNLVQVSRFNEEGFHADLATGRTLDISQGGIRLELHHPLPLRTLVALTLALGDELLEIQGKVVYLEEIDDERCAMGIQFRDMDEKAKQALDGYLDQTGD